MSNMSNEREKRARLSHACDRCRKRHVKCDGDYPICGNCKSVNGECSYSHPGSKRGYVETIDDRLSKIEQVLSKYLEGADTQQQNSNTSTSRDSNSGPELDVHDIVNMAASLRIKEGHETMQVLTESMSSAAMKSNSRYVTTKKNELSDGVSPDSNYSSKGSGGDLQQHSSKDKKIQTLEPPLPTEYKGSKELPPKDLFDHLIQLYLTHGYASRGPIIHKPTFIKQLRDKNNQPSLLLLNSIFAVASFFSDDRRTRTDPNNPATCGDIFWNRSLTLIDDFMDRARLSTVQALLFLIQFCVKSSQNSTRIWMLIGMTMRMSIDLGLNRDCSKWDISKVEKAIRTRVFWAAMNAEIIVCASFGKPLPVYDYNTKFPYEIDDDGEDAQDVANHMHFSKLMKIYGNVLQSKSYFSQPGALRNTLPAIDATLNSWSLALPSHLQFNPPPVGDPEPNSISLFCAYLHQMYNTVLISLHRPYIDSEEFPNFDSRDICNKAAGNITKLANCIPIDSQGVYFTYSASAYCLTQAAAIHVLNVGDPEYSHIGRKNMDKTIDALRKMVREAKLGHGHCGVEDATNMLDYLYQVQLSKIQDNSETQKPIRRISRSGGGGGGDGPNRSGSGSGGGYNSNNKGGGNNSKGGNNNDKNNQVKNIPTPPPSSHQQDSADGGDSIMSALVKTEKSPSLLNRQQPFSTSPLGPTHPRKSLGEVRHHHSGPTYLSHNSSIGIIKPNPTPEPSPPFPQQHLHYQQQPHHHNVQAHTRVQQQNDDLTTTNHHYMEIPPPMVLSSLAEPPVVPSSGYYNTNNFNPNIVEFTTPSSTQLYIGDWSDMVGVGNSHQQIPTTVSSPSPPAMNQNQTNVSVGTLSSSHPNSPSGPTVNPTSIHQDQPSNYLSYPINGDQNTATILLSNNHTMMGSGGLANGTNTNVNEHNIDNSNVPSPQHPIIVQQPTHHHQHHHPMVSQSTNHPQSFPNASTSNLWVQQPQW
ncbi:fungal-specific transcription factor domain-containing protein [Rhizophagus diaphanus]|nr:fungal-specific transcription factor domain-containing protein [Rhizophagus diaphanus] [Rhizophagus sp. MUCL 43196]